MELFQPDTWQEALEVKAAHPEATPIAGGTDLMVEINLDHRRPKAIIDLTRIKELTGWRLEPGRACRVGAGMTYTQIIETLGGPLPGLAMACRTIGSPQIRNRGTVGGNLGTASPAGDAHPVLLACDAVIELASTSGVRQVPAREFFVGPKKSAMREDELISAFRIRQASGPQQFSKVGTRNAMVIAVCSFALSIDLEQKQVGTGIGSAGPTPLRAIAAEEFLSGELSGGDGLGDAAISRFGELVAAAAKPIDDVRGTAAYRRHALKVMAQRCLRWALAEKWAA